MLVAAMAVPIIPATPIIAAWTSEPAIEPNAREPETPNIPTTTF